MYDEWVGAHLPVFFAGRVEGVLWYFPFENDQETVPIDPYTLGRMRLSSHKDGSSQHPGHGPLTQIGPSQIAHFGASQRPQCTQAGKGQPDAYAEQDASKQCTCLSPPRRQLPTLHVKLVMHANMTVICLLQMLKFCCFSRCLFNSLLCAC